MFWYLVRYTCDGIFQVVSKVLKRKSSLKARYYDGHYYDIEIIAKHSSCETLKEICQNIEAHLPIVILTQKELQKGIISHITKESVSGVGNTSSSHPSKILNEALQHNIIILSDINIVPNSTVLASSNMPVEGENDLDDYEDQILDCQQLEESSETYSLTVNKAAIGDAIELGDFQTDFKVSDCLQLEAPSEIYSLITSKAAMANEMELEDSQTDVKVSGRNKQKNSQKRHYCFYCHKAVFKIYRHYLQVHKNEKDVREIIVLTTKAGRRNLLDKLRKKGDYIFNNTIKQENQKPILCRETLNNHKTRRDKNVPCPHCLGYYSKYSIRHHINRCMPVMDKKKRRNIQIACRTLLNNIHEKASEDLKLRVFPTFNDDDISNSIRYDEAVIIYGNYLCRKYTTEHHTQQIRSNLRAFGRLVLAIRESNPDVKNLFDVLHPSQVDLIINGIDKVAGLNQSSHLYRAPATAMLLATELKKLCKVLIMEYARKGDKEAQKRMEDLQLIFSLEFHVTVNKKGIETQKVNNRRKKTDLPKTEHIALFRIYLENKIKHYMEKLEHCYSKKDWMHLAEYTLVHLAVFNRKRPGETQRILVEDYKNCEIIDSEELETYVDNLSKEQIKKWARIRFTGKLGKNTALLVHRQLGFKALDLILKYREKAGVHADNRYIFGEPSEFQQQSTFQACNLIRKFAKESGIANSELLRTRLLRKHLATETATSSVDQRLEGRVSDFMSHKREIHQDYYVMTQKRDDITKVSRLLEDFSSLKNDKSIRSTHPKCEEASSLLKKKYLHDENAKYGRNRLHKSPSENEIVSSYSSSDAEYSDEKSNSVTQAELNNIMGKKQTRLSWSTVEKETAREYFYDEIFFGDLLTRQKVKQFFERNRDIYKRRTPHLIMQWIKCERNTVVNKEAGKKGKRLRWSTPEKEVLRSSTEKHSFDGTVPSNSECELILENNKVILKNRNPKAIKSFMYSELRKSR